MSGVVVDTDVASFLFKNHSLASVYGREIEGRTAYLSFMTIAELRRWVFQAGWGKQRLQSGGGQPRAISSKTPHARVITVNGAPTLK